MEAVEDTGEPQAAACADLPHPRLEHAVVVEYERVAAYWAGQDQVPAPVGPTPATTVPSGWLALELDLDLGAPARLGDVELVDAIVGFERVAAWAQAKQATLIAELAARRPPDDADAVQRHVACEVSRFAADEVGVALHLSRGRAMLRVDHALALTHRLPATRALWEQGLLDERKVAAICYATDQLSAQHAARVQDKVLPRAPGQTVAQLRAALARAVIAVDPKGAAERHRAARAERHVRVVAEGEGMASLWALLSAPDALASHEWLTRLARGLGAEDPRGMDARRADLLVDLLTGRLSTPATEELPTPITPGKPLIQVVVPHTALAGVSDEPGELVGYGPIPAELARELAQDAVWRRLVTDPLSGTLLDYGRTTYHPPIALRDHIRGRDVYCRFPGCRRTVANGEIDHILPFPEGPTSAANTAGYCVHHHHLKHEAGWHVKPLPDGGLEWTTPTGHTHVTHPHDYRPHDPPLRI